jgi:glycosyltransferase involved in cell wall biosynthesis
VIAGIGPEEPRLRRQVQAAGLGERVHFVGLVDDPRLYLAAVDAVGFFSRSETFGLVIAEAMAAKVPVFGLRGEGGYAEPGNPLVTPDNCVFVSRAAPDDPSAEESPAVLDALAERIASFGADPGDYRAMVDRAREWVGERFDAPIQAANMAKLYREAVGEARSRN